MFETVFGLDYRVAVIVGTLAVVGIAGLAMILALQENSTVLDLVAYAWAGFGATFGPVLLLALYWKRATALGALAGIVVGGITVVVWNQFTGGTFDLYEIVPDFVLAGLAMILVSRAGPDADTEVLMTFDEVVKELQGE